MVPPLSSRILNIEAKATINPFITINPLPFDHVVRKRVSGYSADRESPEEEDVSESKQNRAHQVEVNAKRRRIDELIFQAINIKADLERVGINYVPTTRPHFHGHGNVDMSTVKLVTVSKSRPYIEEGHGRNGHHGHNLSDSAFFSDVQTLLQSCQHHYNNVKGRLTEETRHLKDNKETDASSGTTSTDSTNLSDSEDGESIDTPARFQETPYTDAPACEHFFTSSKLLDLSHLNYSNLEDVLSHLYLPRLIIIAQEPHIIVHANAALCKMSGLSSEKVINHPLEQIISTANEMNNGRLIVSFLNEEASRKISHKNEEMEDPLEVTKGSPLKCMLTVSKICQHANKTSNSAPIQPSSISHFVLDFEHLNVNDNENVAPAPILRAIG